MKVVFVNQADHGGGAAIAAYRLFKGVVARHGESRFVVDSKESGDFRVDGPKTKLLRLWTLLKSERERVRLLAYRHRTPHIFSPGLHRNSKLVAEIRRLKPDVVHLHWVQKGTLGIEDIASLGAPVVWTLHDSWAFTGGCHIPYDCTRYQAACGSCPHLNGRPGRDLSTTVLRRKTRSWSKSLLWIVTPSRWLGEKVSASRVLAGQPVTVIPNGIDLQVFKPLERPVAKRLLNLNPDKRYVLFGAMEATSDSNKGFDLLSQSLKNLAGGRWAGTVEALVLGASAPAQPQDLGIPVHYLGRIRDEVSMVAALSAASVVMVPSRSENLPNMVAEGLACGTPGLTFAIGGCPDLLDHKVNGFLAEPFRVESYVEGLDWLLDQDEASLRDRSRAKAAAMLDLSKVVLQYEAVYQEAMVRSSPDRGTL